MTIKLAILGSTRGTNLAAIMDAIASGKLDAEIKIVISNKADAFILERARNLGLRAEFIDPTGLSREAFDEKVSQRLRQASVDLIVLIGYMRILSAAFCAEWDKKIINIHPSLLPAFAGKMDLAVHAAVLAEGVPETGCTVHYVTADVDAGPILLQKKCVVQPGDSPEALKARVQQLEGAALVEAIAGLAREFG